MATLPRYLCHSLCCNSWPAEQIVSGDVYMQYSIGRMYGIMSYGGCKVLYWWGSGRLRLPEIFSLVVVVRQSRTTTTRKLGGARGEAPRAPDLAKAMHNVNRIAKGHVACAIIIRC